VGGIGLRYSVRTKRQGLCVLAFAASRFFRTTLCVPRPGVDGRRRRRARACRPDRMTTSRAHALLFIERGQQGCMVFKCFDSCLVATTKKKHLIRHTYAFALRGRLCDVKVPSCTSHRRRRRRVPAPLSVETSVVACMCIEHPMCRPRVYSRCNS
jgi:hypothetical protein